MKKILILLLLTTLTSFSMHQNKITPVTQLTAEFWVEAEKIWLTKDTVQQSIAQTYPSLSQKQHQLLTQQDLALKLRNAYLDAHEKFLKTRESNAVMDYVETFIKSKRRQEVVDCCAIL